jgi:hypothetical protein
MRVERNLKHEGGFRPVLLHRLQIFPCAFDPYGHLVCCENVRVHDIEVEHSDN